MKKLDLENKNEFVSWAAEALALEAREILEASKRLNGVFAEAASCVLECSGKAVLTGLGKSGHIAKKISSTFASTGTPSVYLHPTEALHGDFGMLGINDCLIAIAFWRRNKRILEVAKYARRLGVKIISITGNLNSSLAKLSHYVLDGSVSKEACPLNLAPTSSSTLALALGDALAVVLMKARGFGQRDFAALHPGGFIGLKLSLVREHMRQGADFPSVHENATFNEVLEKVAHPNFGIVAVLSQEGNMCGCITDGNLRRTLIRHGKETVDKRASEIMVTNPKTIDEYDLAIDALRKMEELKITSLFVRNSKMNNKVVGLVRLHDLNDAKIF